MRLRSGCMLPDGSGAHMSADMPVRNIGQQLTRGPLSEHRNNGPERISGFDMLDSTS
jgi:hypothetical protein